MKGGIAAMAFAIRALAESGFEPKGRLVSVSVPDEDSDAPPLLSPALVHRGRPRRWAPLRPKPLTRTPSPMTMFGHA